MSGMQFSRRETLEAAVREDPYATGRIAELALIDMIESEDRDIASGPSMGALRKLAPQLHEVFAKIAKTRLPVEVDRSLYVLGLQDEDFAESIIRARDFVVAIYGPSDQAMLVELAVEKDVPSFTHSPDAAFSYIVIGQQRDNDLHAAMVHEFGHARFPTHNRYLDEGIAHFLEWKAQGVNLQTQRKRVSDGWPERLDLHALLTYDSSHDPYFSRLHPAGPCKVYGHAALFVSQLFERLGAEGLARLSNSVLGDNDQLKAVEHIERIYGCTMDELEPLGPSVGPVRFRKDSLPEAFLMRLTCALIALDRDRVDALERELSIHSSEASSKEPEILEAWCRIRLFQLLSAVHEHSAEEEKLIWVRGLVARYEATDHDSAVLANLKALLSITEIPFASDEMAGLAHIGNVKAYFGRAMELAPGRVDAEYNLARFELLAPDDVPADRATARAILQKLQHHRHLGAEVRRGVMNSGWAELLVDA